MKYIYSTSQMSKLSLTLHTFSITGSVAGLFLTYIPKLVVYTLLLLPTLNNYVFALKSTYIEYTI